MAEAAPVAGSREPAVQARPVLPPPRFRYAQRKGAAASVSPAGGTTVPLVAGEEGVQEQGGLFACLFRSPDWDRLDFPIPYAHKGLNWPDNLEFLLVVSRA